MRLATWNVNSLKVRLAQVLAWLGQHRPDVLCLQETKLEDGNFPLEELSRAGYQALYSGQKTYNGVAILSRHHPSEVVAAVPGFEDAQKRVLAASVGGIRMVCVYVPNGENVESEKYRYKLAWLGALTAWLKTELERFPLVAVLGDFNIAPEERDVHDPATWKGQVLFSEPEREAFRLRDAAPHAGSMRTRAQRSGRRITRPSSWNCLFSDCAAFGLRGIALLAVFEAQFLDLARERVAAQSQQLRRLDAAPAGMRERLGNQRPLEAA
jgi:exodeoxyribonuclease III